MAADEGLIVRALGVVVAVLTLVCGYIWSLLSKVQSRTDQANDMVNRLEGKVDMIHEAVCEMRSELKDFVRKQ